MSEKTRRLAVIVAADIVGYSRQMAADTTATLERLAEMRAAIVDPKLSLHRGRLVKTLGDGLLIEFSSVSDAVTWAVEVQTAMAARNAAAERDDHVYWRIGVNLGEIVVEDGDIFGNGVNVAARIEPIAEAGGICLSHDVYRQCGDLDGIAFEDLGEQLLKNIPDPVRLWRIAPPATGDAAADDGPDGEAAAARPPPATGLGAAVQRAVERLVALPPPLVALVIVLVGMFLLGGAFVIGVGTVEYPLRVGAAVLLKEVGFLAALNWSLPLVVIFPAIAAIALFGYREIGEILQELARRRMLVDDRFEPVSAAAAEAAWARIWRIVCIVSAVLMVGTLAYAGLEYWAVIGKHYAAGTAYPEAVRLTDPYQERDWAVAALLPPAPEAGRIDPALNAGFAFLVYLLVVGIAPGCIFAFFAYLMGVAFLTYAFAFQRTGIHLVPDLAVEDGARGFDTRAGFQVFEPLFQKGLLVSLLCFLMFFLVHLQNVYLRSPEPDLFAFLAPQMRAPADHGGGVTGLLGALADAIAPSAGIGNLNSALTSGFGAFLFMVLLIVLSGTLRVSARRSRLNLERRLADRRNPVPAWQRSAGREGLRETLASMTYWPMRFPRLNHTLLMVAAAALCMVFYKVGVLVLLAGLVYVGYRVWRWGG